MQWLIPLSFMVRRKNKLIKYSIYILVFSLIGALTLLSSDSAFAQSNQSSQQQQSPPLPPPSVIPPLNNETSQGFGSVTDVQNLTGLNQAAMEGETGGQQQQGNQTGNQSAGGGGQQQGNQTSNQTSNQSAGGGPPEQVAQNETGGNMTGTANTSAFTGGGGMAPETKR